MLIVGIDALLNLHPLPDCLINIYSDFFDVNQCVVKSSA